MNLAFRKRQALGTIITMMMFLIIASALGLAVLAFSQGKFQTFKTTVETIFSTDMNSVQESLVIENIVYHSSTQQFNVTFTNTGYIPVNVTSITIKNKTTPSFTEIATTSSTSPISLITMPSSLSTSSETVTVPGAIILPGQTYTTVIPFHCFCDPISVTAHTARGTIVNKDVAPNVGWYNTHEQYRKKITVNMTKVVGNPSPIILDNSYSITSTGSNPITLSGFTVNSGNNRLLLVGVESSTGTVSNIKIGGVTPLIKANATSNGVDSELWYLTNPPSGKINIVVTMSGAANVVVGAYSFFGVDQTTPIAEGNKKNSASGTNISTMFSTTYSNSWVVDSIAVGNNPASFTPNSGQTNQWALSSGGTVSGGSSYQIVSSTSSTTTGWSWATSQTNAITSVEIRSSAFYNLPLLVNMTDTNLKQIAKSDGSDISFTSCDGMTLLNYEIENYTTTTGYLAAWVQIPQLYSTPNNIVYMYYGNNNAYFNQNMASTWDSTFSAVYHFEPSSLANGVAPVVVSTGSNSTTSITETTIAHQSILKNFNVGTSKDRLLLVGVATDHPYTFASVTYGGTPLTLAVGKLNNADSEFWYLVNPAPGPANIIATLTGSSSNKADIGIGAYSIKGVDQTLPVPPSSIQTVQVNQGSQTISDTVTNYYPNSLLVDQPSVGWGNIPGTDLNGNTQTLGYNMDENWDSSASSYAATTAACSQTNFQWHVISSNQDIWAELAVEVKSNSTTNAESTIRDSTSNQNNFFEFNLPLCGQTPGIISGGVSLNGVNQYFVNNSTLKGMPNTNSPQTVSSWSWVPISARGSFPQPISSLQTTTGGASAVETGYQTSGTVDVWKWGPTNLVSTAVPTLGNWHNVVYTFNGTTHKLYVDGSLKTSSSVAAQSATPIGIYIGTDSKFTNFLNGKVDELEYAKISRSASWIATEYNNQASPSTFLTVGPQQSELDPRNSS